VKCSFTTKTEPALAAAVRPKGGTSGRNVEAICSVSARLHSSSHAKASDCRNGSVVTAMSPQVQLTAGLVRYNLRMPVFESRLSRNIFLVSTSPLWAEILIPTPPRVTGVEVDLWQTFLIQSSMRLWDARSDLGSSCACLLCPECMLE